MNSKIVNAKNLKMDINKQGKSIMLEYFAEVIKVLADIDVNKAHEPDNIPGRLLKETAPEIASPICRLFNLSLGRDNL